MAESINQEELAQLDFLKDKFEPTGVIGEGTFSIVYKANDIRNKEAGSKAVALKKITRTTDPGRIADELRFLKVLDGCKNIIKLLYVERNEDQVVAVFPYFENTDFRDFCETCTLFEIKHYMYNLLIAVNSMHSLNIIHRDLKPTNFLYNRESKIGYLIDFGLAEYEKTRSNSKTCDRNKSTTFLRNSIIHSATPPGYYINDTRPPLKAARAGTRGFRAPEVLFKAQKQTTKIDIWCAGVIFLTLLTRRYPFFAASDDIKALVELSCVFGSIEMKKAARYYERVWRSNIPSIPVDQVPFEVLVKGLNPTSDATMEAFDLLYTLLDLYSEKRITAVCALKHPFFHEIISNQRDRI